MNLPCEQEKGDTKEYMLNDSIFIKFNLIFGDTSHRVVAALDRGINCEQALRVLPGKFCLDPEGGKINFTSLTTHP